MEIQELRHKSQSSGDITTDQSLMTLIERLDSIIKHTAARFGTLGASPISSSKKENSYAISDIQTRIFGETHPLSG